MRGAGPSRGTPAASWWRYANSTCAGAIARRRAWAHPLDDTAEWLDVRCGIGQEAVREELRVAYALLNLPETEAAFDAGELTFAKVRALIQVATLANETALLDFARAMTDAQVVDYCQRLARGGYTPDCR